MSAFGNSADIGADARKKFCNRCDWPPRKLSRLPKAHVRYWHLADIG